MPGARLRCPVRRTYPTTTLKTGDVNGDGKISIVDLSMAVADFGGAQKNGYSDVNASGKVDIADISLIVSNFNLWEWLAW